MEPRRGRERPRLSLRCSGLLRAWLLIDCGRARASCPAGPLPPYLGGEGLELGAVSLLQVGAEGARSSTAAGALRRRVTSATAIGARGGQEPLRSGPPGGAAPAGFAEDGPALAWSAPARVAVDVTDAFARAERAEAQAGPGPLEAAEGLWARHAREAAAAEDVEEDARLAEESARLRQENTQLSLEEARLRQESERLRGEDARLRAEDERLRSEDVGLRHDLTAASTLVTLARRNATVAEQLSQASSHRVKPAAVVACSAIVVAFVGYIVFCTNCFGDSDDADTTDSDSDDFWGGGRGKSKDKTEQRLRDMLDGGGASNRSCCCCTRTMIYFFLGVIVVSGAAGVILWQMGLLQPVMSDLFMYLYVIILLAGFIHLVLCEVWRVLKKLVMYVLDQLQAMNHAFRTFGLKAKHTCSDLMDDGKLNASVPRVDEKPPSSEGNGSEGQRLFTFGWMFDDGARDQSAQPKRKKDKKRWRP